ncbi:hypothetical protein SLS62_011208 [Diatrype stigma]|uniref:NADP-dependent oxidoreductase domain-containing protein n=1 Tax=Diatrype stigma TaxID=117547 RepID=A0AAN9U5A1_9PEZI
MSAKNAPLGKNGPSVPRLGFGLMGMSHAVYGTPLSEEEHFAVLDRAVELGETFWDTADLYGNSEEVIGKWFKRTGKRDQIYLASKFGYVKGSKTFEVDSSGPYAKKACEESLRHYLHAPNVNTPIEETMRALAELKAEGKIKQIGLSLVSSATLRRACKIAHVDAVQTEYSVFSHKIEGPRGTNLLAACRELGVAVVVATPLGRGLLTSTFSRGDSVADGTDLRTRMMPQFAAENRDKNVQAVSQFKALADKKGCTVSQLALAWLLKQGDDIFPIPGTRRIKYLEENWGALDVSLTDEEEAEIRAFAKAAEIAGDTMPAQYEDRLFSDTKEESS